MARLWRIIKMEDGKEKLNRLKVGKVEKNRIQRRKAKKSNVLASLRRLFVWILMLALISVCASSSIITTTVSSATLPVANLNISDG